MYYILLSLILFISIMICLGILDDYYKQTRTMKYKIGDKVKVKTNLIDGNGYGAWNYELSSYPLGSTQTIKEICGNSYITEACPTRRFLTDEMIEEMVEKAISEYVECLKDYSGAFTKGKVYKVKAVSNFKDYMVELDDSGSKTNGWNVDNFKPSTKEAFDAQNSSKVSTRECKLKVGKWYRFIGHGDYRICKIEPQPTYNKLHCDAQIDAGKYIATTSYIANNDMEREVIELDLSEVQQYLPDGHVDKIVMDKYNIGDYVIASCGDILYIGKYKGKSSMHPYLNSLLGDWKPLTSSSDQFMNGGEFEKVIRKADGHEIHQYMNKNPDTILHDRGYNVSGKFFTLEELLAEAGRRYPLGTRYLPVPFGSIYRVSQGYPRLLKKHESGCSGEVNIAVSFPNNNLGLVYQDGKWAEIVSLSEKRMIDPIRPTESYSYTMLDFSTKFEDKVGSNKLELVNTKVNQLVVKSTKLKRVKQPIQLI